MRYNAHIESDRDRGGENAAYATGAERCFLLFGLFDCSDCVVAGNQTSIRESTNPVRPIQ